MGVFGGSRSSYRATRISGGQSTPPNPNPDPNNYKFVKVEEIGKVLIVKINYPDCTNYEGNKILVYLGVTLIELVNQKKIDPHFFNDPKIASPIARFVPTDEGWQLAVAFARMVNNDSR